MNLTEKQFERDGYNHCERCQKSNGILDLHHIVFRSEAPNHENLNNELNLIILCRDCHNWFHSAKHHRIPWVTSRELWVLFPELPWLRP